MKAGDRDLETGPFLSRVKVAHLSSSATGGGRSKLAASC